MLLKMIGPKVLIYFLQHFGMHCYWKTHAAGNEDFRTKRKSFANLPLISSRWGCPVFSAKGWCVCSVFCILIKHT